MIDRRRLLIGGGAGLGLTVAWGLWPRDYPARLPTVPGEQAFGGWLTIASDGRVMVALPQTEMGQGSWTALAQVVADELGADWRTVGAMPAPITPFYANPIGLDSLLEGMPAALPAAWRDGVGADPAPMLTAGSSSIRMFEAPARAAAATARALLTQAAAVRWSVAAADCTTRDGFVVHGTQRLRFAELAEAAVHQAPPARPPVGQGGAGRLMGQPLPRLDSPAKVDGSANFTADIRLPDMVHAAIRQGPIGDSRLIAIDRAAGEAVRGVVAIVEEPDAEKPRWVAAVAVTGWAAQQALDALRPRFATMGPRLDDAAIAMALAKALADKGRWIAGEGDPDDVPAGARTLTADYRVAAGVHAAIETPAAVAAFADGQLQCWVQTQAPGLARRIAARAAGLSERQVVSPVMPVGGGFGAGLDHDVVAQAVMLAMRLKRPVNLMWSRGESLLHDRYRPPAAARMTARLGAGGAILGWRASIATPPVGAALVERLRPGGLSALALRLDPADRYAVAGAAPPYRLPAWAVDHHVADLPLPTGHLRGGAHGYSCFFTECFLDEIAHEAGVEPLSWRIGMLGQNPRLARCLSTAASLGGWEGGIAGSGQGITAHAFRGSVIAVMAEAHWREGRPVVDRLVAAVDCGRIVNPDLVRQQIEGGLIFGLAHALGAATGFDRNLATVRGFDRLGLPRLADTPDLTVELIRSDEAPGGVSELAVPPVAPAIANALAASTGLRARTLPLRSEG